MDKKKTFFKLNNSTFLRLSLNYCCSILNHPIEIANNKDPVSNLISNYEELEKIIRNNTKGQITKFFYFNKNKINNILYEEDEVIFLEYNEENKNFEFYFYLTLLIKENPNILNYEYSIEYVYKLHQENKDKNKNKLNQIIKAKFIIELANEYKLDNDLYDNDNDNEEGKKLGEIIDSNIENIETNNDNINVLNDLGVKLDIIKFISFPIDKLYSEIIFGLIKTLKFGDYNYAIDIIINQLNLDKIDITENMYNNIGLFLDNKENELIMNNYIIKEEKDLNNDIKINFSYILIKYILKNDYYINNLKFINDLKASLKNILNQNKDILKTVDNNKYKIIADILDILHLKPRKHVQNMLHIYYDDFIKNQKKNPETIDITINNGELKIIEYINQIFEIKEFREEYISLLNKEEDFKSLLDLLQIKKEDLGLYEEKLKKILINKTLKEELQIPESTLNKKILNEIFNFKNIEDDENIKNLENELQLKKKEEIPVNKDDLIDNFYNWFNNKKD